ncbi:MAG: zinc ribbon domain-containing protein, partial [Thermodesulfobacteriota bacterium]|nr:zinc ribbon domain-containing protein [Thermodesulfobacteriota bacterium]
MGFLFFYGRIMGLASLLRIFIVLCPKCKTENKDASNYCTQCGSNLKTGTPVKSGKGGWLWLLAGALILTVTMTLFFKKVLPTLHKGVDKKVLSNTSGKHIDRTSSTVREAKGKGSKREKMALPRKTEKLYELPVGWVVISNPWGKEVSRIPAAVVEGSWVAMPIASCLGGDRWVFSPGEADEAEIVGGIWKDLDGMGLWQFEIEKTLDGPELYPWEEDSPMEWLSIISDSPAVPVRVSSYREQGVFIHCFLSKSFNEPGVLFQGNRVVGWTFGHRLDGGYLWNGVEGKDLDYDIRVDHFYRMTFANGREEQFSRALALGKNTQALDRLEAFADGFRLDPELSKKYIPPYLHDESIVKHMRSLITQLVKDGLSRNVADIMDDQIIMETSDPHLLMDVILATLKGYGYKRAIELTEEMGDYIVRAKGRDIPELKKMHSQLYINWIRGFIGKGEVRNGWQA